MQVVMPIMGIAAAFVPFVAIANIYGLEPWVRVVLQRAGSAPGVMLMLWVIRHSWHNPPA